MDNLVDGVENFAAAYPTITQLACFCLAIFVLNFMWRASVAVAGILADAMKDTPRERVLLLIACLALAGMAWVNSSAQHERIEDEIRGLSNDLDRIAWKLDESACRESP